MYKVGDSVLLYSWDELVNKYTTREYDTVKLPEGDVWFKDMDNTLPSNRIITLNEIVYYTSISGWKIKNDDVDGTIYPSMIKSHANEYYLQQIKEEL